MGGYANGDRFVAPIARPQGPPAQPERQRAEHHYDQDVEVFPVAQTPRRSFAPFDGAAPAAAAASPATERFPGRRREDLGWARAGPREQIVHFLVPTKDALAQGTTLPPGSRV